MFFHSKELSAELTSCIPRLRRYARALLGAQGGAEELVQDTVERGWSRLSSWRRDGNMRAWLFGIMHSLYVDQLRAARLAPDLEPFDEQTRQPSTPGAQDHALELRDMQAALALLPPEQREVLLLVALEELRYDEVAQALSVPIGTVMSRLARAREKLRALMEGRALVLPLKVVK